MHTSHTWLQVSVQDYMDFVSAAQPDAFEALCDTPPAGVSQAKRVRKSVERTLAFLDETLTILQQSEQVRCVCVPCYIALLAI